MENSLDYLNALIHDGIAIAGPRGMQLKFTEVSLEKTSMALPLAPNVNDKGTGFAGAIFSAMVLCGWGMATEHVCRYFKTRNVWAVAAETSIKFHAPVVADSVATARVESFKLDKKKRFHLKIICTITDPDASIPRVTLKGTYVAAPSIPTE